jgi:K+-transporting ATPase KdpF subunit
LLNPLHRFYTACSKYCPVFPPAPLVSRSEPKAPVRIVLQLNSRSEHGFCIYGCHHRLFVADAGIGRGLCRLGKEKMTWAYVLSGLVSLALLVYLVIALIRAEDL